MNDPVLNERASRMVFEVCKKEIKYTGVLIEVLFGIERDDVQKICLIFATTLLMSNKIILKSKS